MVSWAGRLPPDTSSRSRCQFGVLAVGGGLCECRYGGARWFLRGPAGQWRLHFEARGQGIDGTLRHPFLTPLGAQISHETRPDPRPGGDRPLLP